MKQAVGSSRHCNQVGYTVRAELSGFQTQNRTGVVVNVGQAVTLNLALPVGGLSDQVTVTGEAPWSR